MTQDNDLYALGQAAASYLSEPSLVSEDVRERRIMGCWYLITNPDNRIQIAVDMADACDGRCALGMLAENAGIIVEPNAINGHAYRDLREAYGISSDEIEEIYKLNDASPHKTFYEIGYILARKWGIDHLFGVEGEQ